MVVLGLGRRWKGIAGSACGLMLATGLAACAGASSNDGAQDPSPASSFPGSSSDASSASPSPASSLSVAEQQAFEEAAETALAYRQTLVDLYSGSRSNLNDLNLVAGGELLDRDLTNTSIRLRQGHRAEPLGVRLALVSAEPVRIALAMEPPTAVVRVCLDATGGEAVNPDGTRTRGVRGELVYTVQRSELMDRASWVVVKVASDKKAGQRQC
jgi:hypothetical protein